MKRVNLNANKRSEAGNGQTRKLRKEEQIPAVLYGKQSENILLKIDASEISNLLNKNGENVLVELNVGNEAIPTIIKEVQRDPVNKTIMHVDFQPISLHELIHAEIPIQVVNGNLVERNGWIINKQLATVEVEGEAEKIPQSIKVDVGNLKIGDIIKVSDIEIAQELSILTDKNNFVLSVREFKEEPINLVIDRPAPEEVKNED